MARSLNRVELIGNLTRDPELRYTPQGTAVCTLGIATNRTWQTESGEKKEDVEYHRVIAWNKLAELCSQLLTKGRKVYVEGRIQTRSWTAQDGAQKSLTEIVINDMLILDSKRSSDSSDGIDEIPNDEAAQVAPKAKAEKPKVDLPAGRQEKKTEQIEEDINPDDIPF
jgi:single-strand DNA-binding protein